MISPVIETDTGDYECWARHKGATTNHDGTDQVKKILKVLIEPRRGACQPGQYQCEGKDKYCIATRFVKFWVFMIQRCFCSGIDVIAMMTALQVMMNPSSCVAMNPARARLSVLNLISVVLTLQSIVVILTQTPTASSCTPAARLSWSSASGTG